MNKYNETEENITLETLLPIIQLHKCKNTKTVFFSMCMFGYKLTSLYLYISKLNHVIKLKFHMNTRTIELNSFDSRSNELVLIC